jgi:hypothetical protein
MNTLIDIPCQTKDNARQRLYCAKMGSLSQSTPEYVEELARQIRIWLHEVEADIAQGIQEALTHSQEDIQTENYRSSFPPALDDTELSEKEYEASLMSDLPASKGRSVGDDGFLSDLDELADAEQIGD